MNKARRKIVQGALATLSKLPEMLQTVRDALEEAATEEREYYDNMPESLQDTGKGIKADECATALEEAVETLENMLADLTELDSNINVAAE